MINKTAIDFSQIITDESNLLLFTVIHIYLPHFDTNNEDFTPFETCFILYDHNYTCIVFFWCADHWYFN